MAAKHVDVTQDLLDRTLSDEELDDLADGDEKPVEVTYQTQDYPVDGLVKRLNDGAMLIPQFGNVDERVQTAGFQRGFVWNKAQMDRYIESLLLGYPIPGIFLVRQEDKRLLVLDGQQRLETLRRFYDGLHDDRKFALQNVGEALKGTTYKTLDGELKRRLDDSYMQATVVVADGSAEVDDAIYQIFERLNAGGTQLTPHEIRVALYSGALMTSVERLNEDANWRAMFGAKSKRIRDHEVILRVLALSEMSDQYAKPLKQFLNLYAKINRELAVDATKVGERFLRAAEVLNEQVGPRAVRASRGGSFNAAVAEAVFVATMEAVEKDLSLSGLASKIEDLNADEEFQTSTTSGTSSKDQVEARLSTARRHILR
jgi:hypothetical protein